MDEGDSEYDSNPVDDVNYYAPVFVEFADMMYVDEGDILCFEVFASDNDGDGLSFSVVSGPGSFMGDSGGSIPYSSQSSGGSVESDWYSFVAPVDGDCENEMFYDVTLSVSDGVFSDIISFDIMVVDGDVCNNAPVLQYISDKQIDEGGTLSFMVSASDSDGDSLSFSVASGPGSVSGGDGDSAWYTYVAPSDSDGDDESVYVRIRVYDGVAYDDESFYISVSDTSDNSESNPI